MSNTLQQALETQIDFYTNKMVVNNIVKCIHQEWITKFRLSGKITKRETNELEKRLNALGFTVTFEKQYNCILCNVWYKKIHIDWFNLYYNVHSLENTVATIDSQQKMFAAMIARLELERQSTSELSKIEPQANTLKAAIVYLLMEFAGESQFSKLTTFAQDEMPTAKLLIETLQKLSQN